MGALIVSTIVIVIVCALAYRANARFGDEDRLPMQWWITGRVNWSAPRRLALAFMPVLTIVFLGFYTILTMTGSVRAGQERLMFPLSVVVGAALVAMQRLHFWLIERTLRKH